MPLSDEEVVSQFNINTNMSVDELEKWLDNPKSKEAGTGVGIESGHKIIEILKKNPEKDPAKYDKVRLCFPARGRDEADPAILQEDIEHMRKVVK